MGGGDGWINQRQMEQKVQVQKAYTSLPVNKHKDFNEIKMDGIDQAYVWARTFTPSWVMGLIFIAGILALAPMILKRIGLNIRLEKTK